MKFFKELDLQQLLLKSRDSQNFRDIMLNPEQKILLKLSSKNLIHMKDGDDKESSDATRDIYEDLIRKMNESRHQPSPTSQLCSLFYLGGLKRMLNRYRDHKMDQTDKRLLETFYHDQRYSIEKQQVRDFIGLKGMLKDQRNKQKRGSVF